MKTIRRNYLTKAKSRDDGTTTVIASTDAEDRYADKVEQDFDLSRFKQNPIIAFAHRYDIPPVGRAEDVKIVDGKLVARIKWDDSPENDLGRLVKSQFERGFLSAVSVGFNPGKSTPRNQLPKDHKAYGEKGLYFEGPQELLEISATPIPANPEALAVRSYGGPMKKHILNVEETDDTFVITYAKPESADEVDEVDEIEGDEVQETAREHEPDHDDEDEDEVEGMALDDDEDEDEVAGYDNEKKKPKKSYRKATRRALRSEVRRALIDLLGTEPEIVESKPKRRRDPVADVFGH